MSGNGRRFTQFFVATFIALACAIGFNLVIDNWLGCELFARFSNISRFILLRIYRISLQILLAEASISLLRLVGTVREALGLHMCQ